MRLWKQIALATMVGAFSLSANAETALRVGSEPDAVPFTFLNAKTNKIEGLMIDMIEEVGKEAGFTVSVQPMTFSALIPSLQSGKIDIISDAMYGSPTRAKVVDFTQDVYAYGDGLIVPKGDTHDYKSLQELKGKRIGAQLGTRYIDFLKNSGVTTSVGVYDSLTDLMRDVSNGRLDAGIGDAPVLSYSVAHAEFPNLRLVKSYEPSVVGPINIAVRKDEPELLVKINAALTNMKKDGRYQQIIKKWNLD